VTEALKHEAGGWTVRVSVYDATGALALETLDLGQSVVFATAELADTAGLLLGRAWRIVYSDRAQRPRRRAPMNECVLVVEDDLALQALYRELLTSLGYRVEVAATGAQALAAIQCPERIDVVVLDLYLPGEVSGDAIVTAMSRKAPVIVVTGSADDALERRLKADGASALLRKPFNVIKLVEAVRAAVASGPA